jgi:hypothetical protein
MPGRLLFAPERHEPLVDEPWSDARARQARASLVDDLVVAYRGEDLLWPNHPDDLEDDPDVPLRTLYFGAGGIVWALARLERTGHAAPGLDLVALAAGLPDGWRAAPEFATLYPPPQPSLLMGAAGVLGLADALRPDPLLRDQLAGAVAANARNPARELLWGSPGTMLAALAADERTGEPRWATLWRESAEWLVAEWHDEVWEQDLYGSRSRYVGPGHGFAGNVHALLRGRRLLEPAVAAMVERRAAGVIERQAEREGGLVQWPALLGDTRSGQVRRTQWCHGAPGMVIALGGLLPADPAVDELLVGGGELTWHAGPLRASASLCHGTAGNGYAFLRLFDRTGDERWLARARAFALHAVRQSAEARRVDGCGRHPLFTGDAGVAVFLAACLDADARFPLVDGLDP